MVEPSEVRLAEETAWVEEAISVLVLASLRKMEVAVVVNTEVPLKVVLEPMRSISARMAWNSVSSAPR